MKFNIKITQFLQGNVEIEAENAAAALTLVDQMYNRNGAALPDMEDAASLQFTIVPDRQVEIPRIIGEHPTAEDIEHYLIHQGCPHPSAVEIDTFLNGGDKQAMYDEAVRNEYSLIDVDRWCHITDILEAPISFGAAMMIDSSLWEEEYEVMEINKLRDIIDTPKNTFINRLAELGTKLSKGEDITGSWKVTEQDITMLCDKFSLFLPKELVQQLSARQEAEKPSLTSLIQSADIRAAGSGTKSQNLIQTVENHR